jgi:hypothetical protein
MELDFSSFRAMIKTPGFVWNQAVWGGEPGIRWCMALCLCLAAPHLLAWHFSGIGTRALRNLSGYRAELPGHCREPFAGAAETGPRETESACSPPGIPDS